MEVAVVEEAEEEVDGAVEVAGEEPAEAEAGPPPLIRGSKGRIVCWIVIIIATALL